MCAGSPVSPWRLFIDNFIVHHIRKCTVTEAHRQMQNQTFALTLEELESLLLSCARGELQEKVAYHCTSFGLKKESAIVQNSNG